MGRQFSLRHGFLSGILALVGMANNVAALTAGLTAVMVLTVTPAHAANPSANCSAGPTTTNLTIAYTAATLGTLQTATTPNISVSCTLNGSYKRSLSSFCKYGMLRDLASGANTIAVASLTDTATYTSVTVSNSGAPLKTISGYSAVTTTGSVGVLTPTDVNLASANFFANGSFTITFKLAATIAAAATSSATPGGTYTATLDSGTFWGPEATSSYVDACEEAHAVGQNKMSSNNINLTVTIPESCFISSVTAVNFGTVTSTASAVLANGVVAASCVLNKYYTIYLGDGNHRDGASSGWRNMTDGAGHYLQYQLYKESARTTIWDSTGGTATTGNAGGVNKYGQGSVENISVYGSIPAGAPLSAVGNYSDTVVVTLTY